MICYDTNCLVARLLFAHEDKQVVSRHLQSTRDRQLPVIVVSHSLLEAFSTLTRMRHPSRLAPVQAIQLLRDWVSQMNARIVAPAVEAFAIMSLANDRGRSGGAIYDASIAYTAHAAGATTLVTFNVRDFVALAPAGLRVIHPSETD